MNAWEKLDKAVKEWKSGRTKGTPSSAPTPDIAQQIDNSLTNAFTEGYHRGRQSVYDDAAAIEEARKQEALSSNNSGNKDRLFHELQPLVLQQMVHLC